MPIVARVGGICGSAADLHLHFGLDEDFPQSSGLSLSPPGPSPFLSCAAQLAHLTAAQRQRTLERRRLWKSSATAERRGPAMPELPEDEEPPLSLRPGCF